MKSKYLNRDVNHVLTRMYCMFSIITVILHKANISSNVYNFLSIFSLIFRIMFLIKLENPNSN